VGYSSSISYSVISTNLIGLFLSGFELKYIQVYFELQSLYQSLEINPIQLIYNKMILSSLKAARGVTWGFPALNPRNKRETRSPKCCTEQEVVRLEKFNGKKQKKDCHVLKG
jgi:hypothetical protein